MGQVLPLPSRIPRPNAKQLEKLHALGIKPDLEETEENKKEWLKASEKILDDYSQKSGESGKQILKVMGLEKGLNQ